MTTPPGMLGAALLFWGVLTGWWPAALPMVLVLEAARFLRRRFNLDETQCHRWWDVSCALCVGAALYHYGTRDVSSAVLGFLGSLPLVFFPFVAALAYASRGTVPWTTFLWRQRRRSEQSPWEVTSAGLNVGFPYLVVCLLATSVANVRDLRYYAGLCALAAWTLWSVRPRRVPWPVAALLFLVVLGGGYAGQAWLRDLQSDLERRSTAWFSALFRRESPDLEMQTAIGRLGRLKLSGRVVLRAEPPPGQPPPRLLREVSFSQFRVGAWYARQRSFRSVIETDEGEWPLAARLPEQRTVTLTCYLPGGRAVLPLPLGVRRIRDLRVGELERNRFGVVRVNSGPDVARFQVSYGSVSGIDGAPDAQDVQVPAEESAALAQITAQLGLAGQPPAEVIRRLGEFFANDFRYTIKIKPTLAVVTGAGSPLSKFLLRHRSGHCEYFASATALLLRHLGIPARYATGYAVDEESRSGNTYLVRERHGHAWALAWIDGAWRDVDTTPALAGAISGRVSAGELISDWWSGLWLRFALWRWETGQRDWLWPMVGFSVPLAGFLLWRLRRRSARLGTRLISRTAATSEIFRPGLDSELFELERALAALGLARHEGETFLAWGRRVAAHPVLAGWGEGVPALVRLHYRHRFDPVGLAGEERARLAALAREGITALPAARKAGRRWLRRREK